LLPAITAASAALTAAPTAADTLRFGTRFINVQWATVEFRSIQGSDGLVAILRARYLYESEPAWLARITVSHEGHSIDCAVSCEELAQLVFSSIEV
jgi:hypothetical protein